MHAELYEYTENYWIMHNKKVKFMVCELDLNKPVTKLWKIKLSAISALRDKVQGAART